MDVLALGSGHRFLIDRQGPFLPRMYLHDTEKRIEAGTLETRGTDGRESRPWRSNQR
jgi:hypothetical protein